MGLTQRSMIAADPATRDRLTRFRGLMQADLGREVSAAEAINHLLDLAGVARAVAEKPARYATKKRGRK